MKVVSRAITLNSDHDEYCLYVRACMCLCVQASDGSSSRDDLPTQLLRKNDQIRKLEAKLSGRTC